MNHNDMISTLVDHLSRNSFFDVRANRTGFTPPRPISWKKRDDSHIPDVTAILDNTLFIFVVETCLSLDDEENRDRWRLFSAYARERRCFFAVVVPQSCREQAVKRCRQLNVPDDIWVIG